ncbi:transmembrane protein [Mycobacterium tuberculosis]|nr:transmembrane protein [Mycobacterium tuberculosis]
MFGQWEFDVSDWFLITFAAVVLFVLARDLWGRRRGWIR